MTDNQGVTVGVNGHYDFFLAKLGVGNNCNCSVTKALPTIMSYVNNLITVSGTSAASVDSMYWIWGDGTKTKYTTQGANVQHTYSNLGSYFVCLRTYNSCGIGDSCFNLNLTAIDNIINSQIEIYPNPADDYFIINNTSSLAGKYYLFDKTGRIIKTGNCNNNKTTVDIKNMNTGIYMLQIKLENGQVGYRKVAVE
jgi:hypothetical protein